MRSSPMPCVSLIAVTRAMRRAAGLSALAALVAGLPLVEARDAAAGDRCCRHGRAYYRAPPANPWAAWRAYYGAEAQISRARRAGRAYYYYGTGRALPSRYFGPPTNYYAESYDLTPYAYFNCPLARRGDGVCAQPDFFFGPH